MSDIGLAQFRFIFGRILGVNGVQIRQKITPLGGQMQDPDAPIMRGDGLGEKASLGQIVDQLHDIVGRDAKRLAEVARRATGVEIDENQRRILLRADIGDAEMPPKSARHITPWRNEQEAERVLQ